MKISTSKTLLAATAMLLMHSASGCTTTTGKAEVTLSAEQVKALFTGKTVNAIHAPKKAPVNLFYDSNGEVRGIFASGKQGKTTWHVNDNGGICLVIAKKDTCFSVVKKGAHYNKYLTKPDGAKVLIFNMETFTEGNPNQF